MDFKESCPSGFSSRRVREGSHPPAPCRKGCTWCHHLRCQVKLQLTLLLGWPQQRCKTLQEMVSISRGIFLILLYCSQTLPRAVWFKTRVYWAPPECSTPGGDTLSARRREGFSSPVPTQSWGPGQSIASYLVSPAADQASEPHYLYIALNRKLNL